MLLSIPCFSSAAAPLPKDDAPTRKPNILFLLVDDLGWADVGYQGNKQGITTPNIDRLASDGMIFTDAYAACSVCSPTRASIVTGKYPARLQLTSHIPSLGNDWNYGRPKDGAEFSIESGVPTRNWLPLEEESVGEAMKKLGYTTGFFGKWHLGHEPYHPKHQGFDVQVGTSNWGMPPSFYAPYKRTWKTPGNTRGFIQIDDLAKDVEGNEYLTNRLTNEAIRFIKADHDRPWFCYLSYHTVHTPIQPRKDLLARHKDKYAAMVASLDDSVGRLLAFLKTHGMEKKHGRRVHVGQRRLPR